jgi:hypothetical protein
MPLNHLYAYVTRAFPSNLQLREPLVFALDEHINRRRGLDSSCLQAMRFLGLTEAQTNSIYNLAREELYGS